MQTDQQSRFELYRDRVRELAPMLREDAAIGNANSRITDRVIEAVLEAGFIGMAAPAQLGGGELSGIQWMTVIEDLSALDPAVGWCVLTTSSHGGLFGGGFSDEGVQELFGDGMPRIAGAPGPRGRAVRVAGGYNFTGSHQFASGSAFATHFVGGGLVFSEGGDPINAENGFQEAVIVVLPKAEVRETGNWDVSGMRATESIDFEIGPDLFVPEHRTMKLNPWRQFVRGNGFWAIGPDATGPAGHTPAAIGMGLRALHEIATIAPTRKRLDAAFPTLADQPRFLHDLALLDAKLRAVRTGFYEAVSDAVAEAGSGLGPASAMKKNRIIQQVRLAHETASECVRFAYLNAGSKGFRSGHILGQLMADVHTIDTHVAVDPNHITRVGADLVPVLQTAVV